MTLDPAALIAFTLNVFLAVSLISLMALSVARIVFRHTPSARYLLCLIALIAILLSPMVVGIQDRMGFSLLTVSLPASFSPSSLRDVSVPADSRLSDRVQETLHSFSGTAITLGVFLSVWAAGVLWGTVRLIRGWQEATRIRQGIRPWDNPSRTQIRANTERILGCVLPPVYTSANVASPVAVGLIRPIVLLPLGLAEALLPVQLQHILLHECAHIVHRHLLGGVVERITRLLFWMHPLVPLLCWELGRSREEVCDNVASQESGAACYARTLLAIAQGTLPAPTLASALALLGPETSLEQRISGLLHPRRNTMVRIKRGTFLAVSGVALLALFSTVAVRVVAARADTSSNTPPTDPPISEVRFTRIDIKPTKTNEKTYEVALKPATLDGSSQVVHIKLDKASSQGEGEHPILVSGKLMKISPDNEEGQWIVVEGEANVSSAPGSTPYRVRLDAPKEQSKAKPNRNSPTDPFFSHIHHILEGLFAGFK